MIADQSRITLRALARSTTIKIASSSRFPIDLQSSSSTYRLSARRQKPVLSLLYEPGFCRRLRFLLCHSACCLDLLVALHTCSHSSSIPAGVAALVASCVLCLACLILRIAANSFSRLQPLLASLSSATFFKLGVCFIRPCDD